MRNNPPTLLLAFVLLLSFPARSFAQSTTEKTISCDNFSIESAMRFIEMTKAAQGNTPPQEEEWQALFATEGYSNFFSACNNSQSWQQNIRNAFLLVSDKTQQAKVDSILSMPIGVETPFENFFVLNFQQTKERIDTLSQFIQQIDFTEIMRKSHLKAQQHLPTRVNELNPTFKKVYFLSWDPECRAWSNGIYVDINSFYAAGTEGMINLMAHELHHHYMSALLKDRYKRDSEDAAYDALLMMQQEGTADIINKQQMPVDELGAYKPDIVKMYNDDYFSTPQVLKQLDNLTTDYLAGKITEKEYKKARQCAHFGGHTTGDYMVFLIRDQLGLQVAIDCFADIAAFVHRYNEAAHKAGTYVFSDAFVQHIEKTCQELEQK